jgi:uncharacterized repeat protein (TIGR03809 family)
MTHQIDVARGRDTVARWCALAEQRLEYLTELFETGRWRRFHSELAFLENIQEAKAAVVIWRELREASHNNCGVLDISLLGRTRTTSLRGQSLHDQARRLDPQPAAIPERSPRQVSNAAETDRVCSQQAPSAPAIGNAAEPPIDIAAIEQRYPVLRNAL